MDFMKNLIERNRLETEKEKKEPEYEKLQDLLKKSRGVSADPKGIDSEEFTSQIPKSNSIDEAMEYQQDIINPDRDNLSVPPLKPMGVEDVVETLNESSSPNLDQAIENNKISQDYIPQPNVATTGSTEVDPVVEKIEETKKENDVIKKENQLIKEQLNNSKLNKEGEKLNKEMEADLNGDGVVDEKDQKVAKDNLDTNKDGKISEEDAELAEARGDRDMWQNLANIMGGVKSAASAYAGGGLTQLKSDNTILENIAKQAGVPVQELLADRKRKKEQDMKDIQNRLASEKLEEDKQTSLLQRNLLDEKLKSSQQERLIKEDMNNAESELSKKYQDFAKNKFKEIMPNMDFSNMSAQSIDNIMKRIGTQKTLNELDLARAKYYEQKALSEPERLKLSKQGEERRTKKFDFTKKEKFETDARNALKDMRQTEAWKKAETTLSTIPEMELLLDDAYTKGGQSLAMLGPKVAKGIAGEVGVLTEADVTRYVKNPALVGGLMDTIKKAKSGQITETSYENLKRLLELSKLAAEDKRQSAINREATLFARREKMDKDEAREYLDSQFETGKFEEDPRVRSFMKKNNIKDINKAIEILKKHGKI